MIEDNTTEESEANKPIPRQLPFEVAPVAFWSAYGLLFFGLYRVYLFLGEKLDFALYQETAIILLLVIFLLSAVNWSPLTMKSDLVGGSSGLLERLKTLPYPTLFLLLGIAGTFFGVYLGLSELSTADDIDQKELLGLIKGLTLAFTTSLGGIALAFIYRCLVSLFGQVNKPEDGATEIILAIDRMSEKLDTFINDLNNEVVEGLSEALQGLNTQLEQVLTDQLGEAFKQLNASIQSLNQWVIEYRNQVNTLTEAYKANLIGIEEFHDEAEKITAALATVPRHAKGIQDTLEKMNTPLEDFSQLAQQAENAFPIIKRNLEEITGGFSKSSQTLNETQQKTAALAQELAQKVENVETLIKKATGRQLTDFEGTLAAISSKFAEDYLPIAEGLRRALKELDVRRPDE